MPSRDTVEDKFRSGQFACLLLISVVQHSALTLVTKWMCCPTFQLIAVLAGSFSEAEICFSGSLYGKGVISLLARQ